MSVVWVEEEMEMETDVVVVEMMVEVVVEVVWWVAEERLVLVVALVL